MWRKGCDVLWVTRRCFGELFVSRLPALTVSSNETGLEQCFYSDSIGPPSKVIYPHAKGLKDGYASQLGAIVRDEASGSRLATG